MGSARTLALVLVAMLTVLGTLCLESAFAQQPTTSERPLADIVLLVDRSASLHGTDPADDRLKALNLFVSLLDNERVWVISFGDDARDEGFQQVHDANEDRQELYTAIANLSTDKIPAQQATNMLAGLERAYYLLALARTNPSPAEKQAVILLTDGAPCRPRESNPAGFKGDIDKRVKEEKRDRGVSLFAFGFLNPDYKPDDPSDPCEQFDEPFLSELNNTGMGNFLSLGKELKAFTDQPFIRPEQDKDKRPTAVQIADRYVAVYEALFDTVREQQQLRNGQELYVFPGTRTLITVLFGRGRAPNFSLAFDDSTELGSQHSIDDNLVVRQDDPPAGPRTVKLEGDTSNAYVLTSLRYKIVVDDEIDISQTRRTLSMGEPLPAGSEASLWIHLEAKEADGGTDWNQEFATRSDSRGTKWFTLLHAAIHRPGEPCALGEDLTPPEVDGERFRFDQVHLPGDELAPGSSGQFEIVAGLQGFRGCTRVPVTLAREAASAASPTPTTLSNGSRGGGTRVWFVVGGGLLATLVVGAGAVWLLSRQSTGKLMLLGTLTSRSLSGGRLEVNQLNRRQADIGGQESHIPVVGLQGKAASLSIHRTQDGDQTMLTPASAYNVFALPTRQFNKTRLTGALALTGPTELPADATIVFQKDGVEVAQLGWHVEN